MADIGSTLRDTRMRERIDITTVESATKIRAKYLRALENEEWDQLPGPTFVRTFLRTYAEYLGLDPKVLVEEYKQRFERPGPQDMLPFSSRSGGGRKPQRPPRVIPPFVLVGTLVVLLLVALFALGKFGGDDEGGAGNEVEATPTPARTPKSDDRAGRRNRKRFRTPAPGSGTPKQVKLQIVPESEVYVCLEDGEGERLIAGEIITDPTETFRARRLLVTFGNGLVQMRVDGQPVSVEDSDEPVGFDLRPGKDPEPLAAEAQPQCT